MKPTEIMPTNEKDFGGFLIVLRHYGDFSASTLQKPDHILFQKGVGGYGRKKEKQTY